MSDSAGEAATSASATTTASNSAASAATEFEAFHELVLRDAAALLDGERDYVANCANVAALAFSEWAKRAPGTVNWLGFYLLRQRDELVLGPFVGEPACIRIARGRGVCGTALATRSVQQIADVHACNNHIACDSRTQAEVVVPLVDASGRLFGVLDVDALRVGAFSEADVCMCEQLATLVANGCDWPFDGEPAPAN